MSPETAPKPTIHQLVNSRADQAALADHLVAIAEAIMEAPDAETRGRLEAEYDRVATHLAFRSWAHRNWVTQRYLTHVH